MLGLVWPACGENGDEKFLLQEQTSFTLLNTGEEDWGAYDYSHIWDEK